MDAETQTVTIRKESAEPGEGFPIPFEKFISLDLTNAPWEILQELKEAEGIGGLIMGIKAITRQVYWSERRNRKEIEAGKVEV